MKSRADFLKKNDVKTRQGRDTFLDLQKQVHAEYDMAWKHQKPKKDEWGLRLKLYNNQRRDKEAVGDTTLFTIFQTVLASLYIDRLNVSWEGREEGDEDTADNLNLMAQRDYEDMEKDIVDFEWDWDACFFGRGLVDLSEFERDPENAIFLPLPRNIDPITFLRDPFAKSINGDRRGYGAARFFGFETKMTKAEMEEHPHIFDDIKFEDLSFGSGMQSLLEDSIEARNLAQGNQSMTKQEKDDVLGPNAQYTLTEWNTHYESEGKVKKVKVWLANDREKVIGMKTIEQESWPVLDRPLYPTSHDWDGTSIPDLIEDKQRARAVAQNLGLKAMTADMYPMYIYDSNKITNRNDLNFGFDKFIPVDGRDQSLANAIMPLAKAGPNMQLLDFIQNTLDASAQKATATPEIQQGAMSQEQRTLGEINIIASNVDTRYSLSSKVFGWSEKRFWRQWYRLYKDNFKDKIDEKVLRHTGAFGPKWRKLTRDNIITQIDPDVQIESSVLVRSKQLEERQSFGQYLALALQDPTANRRYGLKKLGRLNGLEKDEIERLFPPTIDERVAEEENDKLNRDEVTDVHAEDDHNVHLEIHAKAADTDALYAHVKTHQEALSLKKRAPELFPQDQEAANMQQPGTEPMGQTPAFGSMPMGGSGAPGQAVSGGMPKV